MVGARTKDAARLAAAPEVGEGLAGGAAQRRVHGALRP